ncbi:DUF983 domain-containing protein [Siculibacillus lacustris]|uniref:DUF983 domain-containing protein n=1 Tax=Siculibacillus lacustris TaxID=1549641 RepID=UPI0013F16D75
MSQIDPSAVPPPARATAAPLAAALLGRCPACGRGKLFRGYLALEPRCEVCGLDTGFADSGDGPAVFVILIVGFLVVAAVLFVEVRWSPPYWVHGVIWLPTILILTLAALRIAKAAMIGLQYRHDAREGRIAGPRDPRP